MVKFFLGNENYWKMWQIFFFFLVSLYVFLGIWIQQAYHKLTNSFSWPTLTFAVNKSLKQKTLITSGNNAHLFFHVAFLNTSKPLTIFAASCIQLPNTVCLPDQIFHMKVLNIHIFFAILILFQQLVLLLPKQGKKSMIRHEKDRFYKLNAKSLKDPRSSFISDRKMHCLVWVSKLSHSDWFSRELMCSFLLYF